MQILRKLFLLLLLSSPGVVMSMEPIDINTADKETLMELNGIGEKRAEAIIEYRERNGPFESVEHLTRIRGIGRSVIKKNREQLTAGDYP